MKFISLILFIFVLLGSYALLGFYLAIRPFKFTSQVTPANYNIPFEEVKFKTSDNLTLHGWFIPSIKPHSKTIILLHGYPANKGDILPSRLFLHKNFNLLFFDFRYFGQSEGAYTTLGDKEVLDLAAAIKFLQTKNINEVGVWGFSLGAAVAIMAAPHLPEIKAIVAESAYANLYQMAQNYYQIPVLKYFLIEISRWWGILFLKQDIKNVSPVEAAKKLRIPVLLLHSKSDQVVTFDQAVQLQQALKDNPNAQINFVDNLHHGQPVENEEKLIEDFFVRYS